MRRVPSLLLLSVIATAQLSAYAEVIEFDKIYTNTFAAPLPGTPNGLQYTPQTPWSTAIAKTWSPMPSIAFDKDDNKGTTPYCSGKYPKHLGTDWHAPKNTQVYAIADGTIVRSGYFTTDAKNKIIGDTYILVESGSKNRWTTTYGHLTSILPIGTKVYRGKPIIGAALFNFNYEGDIPHIHLAIHKGAYNNTGAAVMGFSCSTEAQYKSNKYNFISPESLKYNSTYY